MTTYFGYQTVSDFLTSDPAAYDDTAVEVNPGPASYEGVADTVGPAVVLTVGGGPGLTLESSFDRVFVTADVAGDQMDPLGAEALALAIDRKMLSLDRTRTVGGVRVLGVTRTGGRPTPTSVDDGDRSHLACSYLWQVESGV